MTAQKARDMLLKIDDGTGVFITVAGMRSRQILLNTRPVDITNVDSSGQWRELLAGAAPKTCRLTGSGIFRDQTSDARLRDVFFNGQIPNWQIIIPDFIQMEGPFQITNLNWQGDYNDALRFEMTLESAGEINFIAI